MSVSVADPMTPVAERIMRRAKEEGRTLLNEVESKQLLREAGVPVTDTRLATSRDQAIAIARELGFPVALKIVSADVVHKSDAGGVELGLADETAVGKAYDRIVTAVKARQPKAAIDGVSVQKMAEPGIEVIIGVSTDEQFGHVVMFGLGGTQVEVLKDVSFRIAPLSARDAKEMVREIRGFALLEGFRGSKAVDVEALERTLMSVSRLVAGMPQIRELDLNPVFSRPDGAAAVDARVILG
jgi:acetate---CoA ligase (ADP-forming) subunit beta